MRRLALLLVALAAGAGVGSVARAATATAQAFTVRLSVSRHPTGRPLPRGFLGIALEYRSIPALAGSTDPAQVDPVLVTLIRNLVPQGHPVLRIGGQSADRSWWPVPGMRRPPGITYDLTPGWVADARALAQAADARLILGLGLEADRPRIDALEAARLLDGIGRPYVDALEVGNEPALYPVIPWYRRLGRSAIPWYAHVGQPVFARPPSYDFSTWRRDWSRAVAALPPAPLAGPDVGTLSWLDDFEAGLPARSAVRVVTWHDYGLSQCVSTPSSSQYPTVAHLLSVSASRATIGDIGPAVALAHRRHERFRIDEMGSVSCNGRAGVSDTLASALWLLDALFAIDADGVDGVNLHTFPGLDNGLFDLSRSAGGWQGAVHPLYYGALMFSEAAPAGSRLLPVGFGAAPALRGWATLGGDGRVRVLLIDASLRARARVLVPADGASGGAALVRLRAAGARATSGITLGGQTFGRQTATGVLPAPVAAQVLPRGGTYAVGLAPGSAALLTLPAGSGSGAGPAAPAAG